MNDHGIYYWKDLEGQIVYIGSTGLPLERVEYNHRNARQLWPNESLSRFRRQLEDNPLWTIDWLVKRFPCETRKIELAEQVAIQRFRPLCNKDLTPYQTSIWRGRYQGYDQKEYVDLLQRITYYIDKVEEELE